MSFVEQNSLFKVLKGTIQGEIGKMKGISIYKVTEVNTVNYTVNIRDLNFMQLEYTDVPIAGMNLGHYKGVMWLPEPDDLVLVLFLGGQNFRPFIIGSIFDIFTQIPDGIPTISRQEIFMTNKTFGSIIKINNLNEIELKVADSTGNLANGARFKLKPDGSFKLFSKDNYGIECDASGNVTIRGTTVTHTQSAGTF